MTAQPAKERVLSASYWQLVRAAGKLFEERDYHQTSVRDIADAVGMTSGSFFYHFATKEDVLVAVLEHGMIDGLEVARKRMEGVEGSRNRLHALIHGHLEALHSQNTYAHKVWLRDWQQVSPAKRPALERLSRSYRDIWRAVLDEARREGLIASDTEFFRRMAVGALNWTVHWVRAPGKRQVKELADQFTQAFLNEPGAHPK